MTPAFPKPERRAKAARKPLLRSKPMRRTWMKRRSSRRIGRETPAEKLHKKLIREARVCALAKYADAGPCTKVFQVAHLGPGGGTGRQHGDWTQSTLMCADDPRNGRHGHHQDLDQRRGIFRDMTEEDRAAFCEREIHLAREFVAGRRTVSA